MFNGFESHWVLDAFAQVLFTDKKHTLCVAQCNGDLGTFAKEISISSLKEFALSVAQRKTVFYGFESHQDSNTCAEVSTFYTLKE